MAHGVHSERLTVGDLAFDRYAFDRPHVDPVNVFVIGSTVIDTGHPSEPTLRWFRDQEELDRVVLTHSHVDHVGASIGLKSIARLPHVAFQGVFDELTDLEARMARMRDHLHGSGNSEGYPQSFVSEEFPPDLPHYDVTQSTSVSDGDTIDIDGMRFEVLHTPGHEYNHLSLWCPSSEVAFVGDAVMPSARFDVGVVNTSVGDYLETLERLSELGAEVLIPSHGDPITDVSSFIENCLTNVNETIEQVQTVTDRLRDPVDLREVAVEVFEPESGMAAKYFQDVTAAYVRYLDDDGSLSLIDTSGETR